MQTKKEKIISEIQTDANRVEDQYGQFKSLMYSAILPKLTEYAIDAGKMQIKEIDNRFTNKLKNIDAIIDVIKVTLSVSGSILIGLSTLIKRDIGNYSILEITAIQIFLIVCLFAYRTHLISEYNNQLKIVTDYGKDINKDAMKLLGKFADRDTNSLLRKLKNLKGLITSIDKN